jgi:CDP-diacylglycerol---glycerol-3-phosphate 3-phosphatidyltransferase
MTLPNLITFSRILLSPVFFCVFYIPRWFGNESIVPLLVLWLLFGIIELTDLIDGKVARKLDQTSDTGKLLDPFADSLSRLTYFLCFAIAGIMEVWIFLILLYRDLSVSFVRLLMAKKGIVMSARMSGKIKAWVYAVSGIVGLGMLTLHNLSISGRALEVSETITYVFFALSAAVALWTLGDYLRILFPTRKKLK